MYPPNKKAPTRSNTPKSGAKRQNTYKTSSKSAGNKKNGHVALLSAIAVGGLLALISTSGKGADQPTSVAPGTGTTVAPKPTTPTTKAPAPVATAPAPPQVVTAPPANLLMRLVVNSFNGEGLYAGTKKNYTLSEGYGLYKIVHLPNRRFVGFWTGREENNMLQAFIKINGYGYNVWVDKGEVQKMTQTEYNHHMKVYPTASTKTTEELKAIMNFNYKR